MSVRFKKLMKEHFLNRIGVNNNGAKRFLHELPQTAAYKKKQSRACNIHIIHSFERF